MTARKLQTIVFPKDEWSIKEAMFWIKGHGFHDDVDITDASFRFRQRKPYKNAKYYAVPIYHHETVKNKIHAKKIDMVFME